MLVGILLRLNGVPLQAAEIYKPVVIGKRYVLPMIRIRNLVKYSQLRSKNMNKKFSGFGNGMGWNPYG